MRLIGSVWKRGNAWSWRVLIGRGLIHITCMLASSFQETTGAGRRQTGFFHTKRPPAAGVFFCVVREFLPQQWHSDVVLKWFSDMVTGYCPGEGAKSNKRGEARHDHTEQKRTLWQKSSHFSIPHSGNLPQTQPVVQSLRHLPPRVGRRNGRSPGQQSILHQLDPGQAPCGRLRPSQSRSSRTERKNILLTKKSLWGAILEALRGFFITNPLFSHCNGGRIC